jgi:DNA polymerase-1
MTSIPGALAKAGLTARMLLQVHDGLVLEAREDEAEKTAAGAKEVMEAACTRVLKLSVRSSSRPAHNWDDAH